MSQTGVIPPPPAGFQLEQAGQATPGAIPPPPDGFQLEEESPLSLRPMKPTTDAQGNLHTILPNKSDNQIYDEAHPKPPMSPELAARVAVGKSNIAQYPENQQPPDPNYVARKKAFEAVQGEPEAPQDFEEDPEQERRIKAQEEVAASKTAIPDAALPALAAGKKYAVDPFEKMSAAGAKAGGEIAERALVTPPGPTVTEPPVTQAEVQQRLESVPPSVRGITRAAGSTVGGMAADPRMWPFFFAGPEVSPALRTATGAGFTTQMTAGTIEQAGEFRRIMNDPNIPQDQKWEAGASTIISALMAGSGGVHMLGEFSHLPAQDQEQIRQRIREKAPELAKEMDQMNGQGAPAAEVPAPPAGFKVEEQPPVQTSGKPTPQEKRGYRLPRGTSAQEVTGPVQGANIDTVTLDSGHTIAFDKRKVNADAIKEAASTGNLWKLTGGKPPAEAVEAAKQELAGEQPSTLPQEAQPATQAQPAETTPQAQPAVSAAGQEIAHAFRRENLKGMASKGFIDAAWKRAQANQDMPFSDRLGSVEARLAEARSNGKLNSRDDVAAIVRSQPPVSAAPQPEDNYYEQAKKLSEEFGKASTSLLQRRLKIGYAEASSLIDRMAQEGLVGDADGAKPREWLGKQEATPEAAIAHPGETQPRPLNVGNVEAAEPERRTEAKTRAEESAATPASKSELLGVPDLEQDIRRKHGTVSSLPSKSSEANFQAGKDRFYLFKDGAASEVLNGHLKSAEEVVGKEGSRAVQEFQEKTGAIRFLVDTFGDGNVSMWGRPTDAQMTKLAATTKLFNWDLHDGKKYVYGNKKPFREFSKAVDEFYGRELAKPERRTNPEMRAKFEAMTPEERTQALVDYHTRERTSELTGLPNKKAFDEDATTLAQSHPHVGYADLDDFKAYNTALGHDGADTALTAVGELFQKAINREPGDSIKVYHRSGDEFNFRSTDPERIKRVVERVNKDLAQTKFTYKTKDGTILEKKGTGLSHGIGQDHESAEQASYADKQARKAAGLREGARDVQEVDTRGAAGEPTGVGNAPERKENLPEEKAPEVKPQHEFASTQINIPKGSAQQIAHYKATRAIREQDLAPEGREDNPHITVRFGLKDDSPETIAKIKEAAAKIKPFQVAAGKTAAFPEGKDGVPVIAEVQKSPELDALRKQVEGLGDFKPDDHGEYRPHITLAYVKPGTEGRYVGTSGMEGARVNVNHITVSTKDRQEIRIPFGGKEEAAPPTRPEERQEHPGTPKEVKSGDTIPAMSAEKGAGPSTSATPQGQQAELPTKQQITQVLAQHPLVKLRQYVKRAFAIGSTATGKVGPASDFDVLLEVRGGAAKAAELQEDYRRKIQKYFMDKDIRGKRDDLHPQWNGRRVDVYFTHDADAETRPKVELKTSATASEKPLAKEEPTPPIKQFDQAIAHTGAEVKTGQPSYAMRQKIKNATELQPDNGTDLQGKFKGAAYQREYFKAALGQAKEAWAGIMANAPEVEIGKRTTELNRGKITVSLKDTPGTKLTLRESRNSGEWSVEYHGYGTMKDGTVSVQQTLASGLSLETAKSVATSRLQTGRLYDPEESLFTTNGQEFKGKPTEKLKPLAPTEMNTDQLYIKVPDDGHFLINNNPGAIERALKGADEGFATPKAQASPTLRVPKSPKEFDNEKYIAGLEKEIAELEDKIEKARKSGDMGWPHYQEELKAAKENLAEAKTGTVPEEAKGARTGERGSATPAAMPIPALVSAGAGIIKKGVNLYHGAVDKLLEKVHMGETRPEIRQFDPDAADLATKNDAGSQYHKAVGEYIARKVTGPLTEAFDKNDNYAARQKKNEISRDRMKGFHFLADAQNREFAEEHYPEDYHRWQQDPKIAEAIKAYKPFEEQLRDAVKQLGGKTIDEDYIKRVMDFATSGVVYEGKTLRPGTEGPEPMVEGKTTIRGAGGRDNVVTPQIDRSKSRTDAGQYYWDHGVFDFGPSFEKRWSEVMRKLDEHRLAVHAMSLGTRIAAGEESPDKIFYNGQEFYRPDVAKEIREVQKRGVSSESKALADSLGVSELPTPRQVREYDVYEPLRRGNRFENAARNLASSVLTGNHDFLTEQAGKVYQMSRLKYAVPKEIAEALNDAGREKEQGALSKVINKTIAPITQFIRQQIVGLAYGIPHMANILRKVVQAHPGAALNPVGWVDAFKVAFSKELKARGISGVEDKAFDSLLRNAAISDAAIPDYKHYIEGNFNPTNWEGFKEAARTAGNAFRKGGREGAKVTPGSAIAGVRRLAVEPLNRFSEAGHRNLFSAGSIDQRARLWLADFLKDRYKGMGEEKIAHQVNQTFGRYNRASWTDVQRGLAPFMLFPGWDYSSITFALKHPFKTAIAPAVLMMLANAAVRGLGGQQTQDEKHDTEGVHIGKFRVRTNLLNDNSGQHLWGWALRGASAAMEGKSKKGVVGDVVKGIPGDVAGVTTGTLNPIISAPIQLGANRIAPASGQEIIKEGDLKKRGRFLPNKGAEDLVDFGARRMFPLYDRATQAGQRPSLASVAGAVGVNVSERKKKRR